MNFASFGMPTPLLWVTRDSYKGSIAAQMAVTTDHLASLPSILHRM